MKWPLILIAAVIAVQLFGIALGNSSELTIVKIGMAIWFVGYILCIPVILGSVLWIIGILVAKGMDHWRGPKIQEIANDEIPTSKQIVTTEIEH